MDKIGALDFAWIHGYSGQPLFYIDDGVLCHQCGKHVKFLKDDGSKFVFLFPGKGHGPFTVHRVARKFAMAEHCLNPKIYVYDYPSMDELTVLEGGAMIEFQKVEFSYRNYLLSISGLPDFKLIIWDYEKNQQLSSVTMPDEPCTSAAFNPLNWRQICVTTTNSLTFLHVEQAQDVFIAQPQKVKLPPEDEPSNDFEDKDNIRKSHSALTKFRVAPSSSAIAGCGAESLDFFAKMEDSTKQVSPVAQVWTPQGDIFISGDKGHLLKVNSDGYNAEVVHFPRSFQSQSDLYTRNSFSSSRSGRFTEEMEMDTSQEFSAWLGCLALHQLGLYAVSGEGLVLVFDISKEMVKVVKTYRSPAPLTSLTFSYDYLQLAVGSSQGSIFTMKLSNTSPFSMLTGSHFGEIVGMGMLITSKHVCVSVRDNGMMQAWSIKNGIMLSSYALDELATCLACSPLMDYVTVGTKEGYVYFVDFTDTRNPRIVHRIYLYKCPVAALAFDDDGLFLFTGGDDGNVYVLNGHPSNGFSPLGYVATSGQVRKIATVNTHNNVKVAVIVSYPVPRMPSKYYLFCLDINASLFSEESEKTFKNAACEFLNQAIHKVKFDLPIRPCSVALGRDDKAFIMCSLTGDIHTYVIPKEAETQQEDSIVPLKSQRKIPGHQLPGGEVMLSLHRQWLASYSPDGVVMIRAIGTLDKYVTAEPFSHHGGGVLHAVFSEDCCNLLATGAGGLLCCYKWRWASCGSMVEHAKSEVRSYQTHHSSLEQIPGSEDRILSNMDTWQPPCSQSRSPSDVEKEQREIIKNLQEQRQRLKNKAFEEEEIYISPPPSPIPDSTWLQDREFEVLKEEQKTYAEKKKKLRVELLSIRREIVSMRRANDEGKEIERLDGSEFHLDIDQQIQWMHQEESELEKTYVTEVYNNLEKDAEAALIKHECWDKMFVKGRSIKAFNSELLVANFPLVEQSREFLNRLNTVVKRRNLELREAAVRNKLSDESRGSMSISISKEEQEIEMTKNLKHQSHAGSLGDSFGGGSDIFYSQFEINQRHQKLNQIVMLQDAIYRIKMTFDKEFDSMYERKEQEVSRIQEKNKRIAQIFKSLNREDTIQQPGFSVAEKPEQLFVVLDHEIQAEKVLSEQEKRKLEKEREEEEERQRLAKKDNQRERALDTMMGGMLEILREDELKQDIPIPPFMQEKEEFEWTVEEIKLAQEYEQKVKDLNAEREIFRKQLEAELQKLQEWIADCMDSFDEALMELYGKKMAVTMAVLQEELKIIRLRRMLLLEEELKTSEKELQDKLKRNMQLKTNSTQTVAISQEKLDAFHHDFEVMATEDKLMEKSFWKEFSDLSTSQTDYLHRHFKKRPKVIRPKLPDTALLHGKVPNPFWEQVSRQMAETPAALDSALAELDSQAPEGIGQALWQKLCSLRREKIDSENRVKQTAHELVLMQEFVLRIEAEDDALKQSVQHVKDRIFKLKEDQEMFMMNLEVQLVMKQAQIETSPVDFIPNFLYCLLLKRSFIDNINSTIRHLGKEKVAEMEESKDFGKTIIHLEWDHKKMAMEMEDLEQKLKDIQFMKITREVQVYLYEKDYETKKAQDIAIMEQTIALQKKYHGREMEKQQRAMADLQKAMRQREAESLVKKVDLTELNVLSNEYRHIAEFAAASSTEQRDRDQRYHKVLHRRRLVDLARAQAQEISALKAEIKRLQLKCFPAFVSKH